MRQLTPPPSALYTCDQLMTGYQAEDVHSIARTFTFEQYLAFEPYKSSGILDRDGLAAIGAHDARINQLLLEYLYALDTPQKIVGMMGGHSVGRSTAAYADLANLARFLSQNGYLIVTGGGPGLMEAGHLGVYGRALDDAVWDQVVAQLRAIRPRSDQDIVPNADPFPAPDAERLTLAQKEGLHRWYHYGAALREAITTEPGKSLTVSTLQYGTEPVMPMATIYAGYFQNSIRESQLVRESRAGIIYGRGGGGTLREIWQDLEENYYVKRREELTPMIFFDADKVWGGLNSNGSKPLDIFGTILRVMNTAHGVHDFSWEDKIVATTSRERSLACSTSTSGSRSARRMSKRSACAARTLLSNRRPTCPPA